MNLSKIHHIAIIVSDYEAAKDWSCPDYKNRCLEMPGRSWHASGQTVRVPVHEPEQMYAGQLYNSD